MTIHEFYHEVKQFNEKHPQRDLEEYLLALYLLVLEYKDQEASLELFGDILSKAFVSAPAALDASWLAITEAPDENRMSHKFYKSRDQRCF